MCIDTRNPSLRAEAQLLRRILSAVVIIGICSGSRARAAIRIGHGLSHHNRTMFRLPGKTPMNRIAAASAAGGGQGGAVVIEV
ncbi:hypothetical protein [Mycobacterium avium]|uniref:hypothetical protein n=1 Tax=Mycobacterium avium TaxID=1764 RepID=UPI001CC7FC63|nr:hypothetical protein [Mycobacterium avium]MBZ4519430.1 hypothetical protein [Mycobacterium avium subsp. hominissuis]MBZ4529960.1 hypothetical protein [Mycobacterium avium subsp. hominissuis]MBZ4614480.1 hypothetical protein [Mycobacterium avium subsp. hominissuis]MBZ4619448.1 hypothetical protein [Mycobacterium avium subsp. hominissuis]MBZ4638751.1 hypothetical protein [Mycobacterium avium subsp. hominissuis]